MSDFHCLPTAILKNNQLQLEYLTTAGPRISWAFFPRFAQLAGRYSRCIVGNTLRDIFYPGRHRLWIAPEIPEITDIP